MTEPIIKAPLPPDMKPSFPVEEKTSLKQEAGAQPPKTEDIAPQETVSSAQEGKEEPVWKKNLQNLKEKMDPYFWYVLGGIFFVGLLMGMIFSGGGEPAPVQQPQQQKFRSVSNPDIKTPLKPCGVTGNSWEECVLYVVNFYPQERRVSDFFQLAQKMTNATTYSIQDSNLEYSKVLVKPGYIMEIKIPRRN